MTVPVSSPQDSLKKMTDSLKERLRAIRHVALDMDGTIYLGSTLFPFTLPFLEKLGRLGIGYSFLTNNPTKSVEDYVAKLEGMGVPCTLGQMYTSTTATIDYIRLHYPGARRLFLLGTPSMISQFEAAGFESCTESVDDVPDVVVAAFDRTLVYERLCRCCWWVSKGLPFIATNPDWVCPTDQPTILVDCGSLCKCIEGATGRVPDVFIGKPNPEILYGALARHSVSPAEAAVVGDRMYTDVKTALNAGAVGVLVLSGESTMQTALDAPQPPTLVCRDIEEFGNMLEEAAR